MISRPYNYDTCIFPLTFCRFCLRWEAVLGSIFSYFHFFREWLNEYWTECWGAQAICRGWCLVTWTYRQSTKQDLKSSLGERGEKQVLRSVYCEFEESWMAWPFLCIFSCGGSLWSFIIILHNWFILSGNDRQLVLNKREYARKLLWVIKSRN